MSWWTKNRKKVGLLAGLLGGGVGAAGLAGAGPLAGLLGGTGEAIGAGFAGASLPAGAMGPTTAGAGGAMGVGSLLGGNLPPVSGSTALLGANMAAGAMQPPPQQPPAPPPPPPAPAPQGPTFSGYGSAQSGPPPGIDPAVWAKMPEYMKQQLRGMA